MKSVSNSIRNDRLNNSFIPKICYWSVYLKIDSRIRLEIELKEDLIWLPIFNSILL